VDRPFSQELDDLLDFIQWAEDLKTKKGEPANSFCLAAMQRFNREMATYKILHSQKKYKPKKKRLRSK
tara:strand:+ start:80 stop:283 length:204 start_codon:yes stop_codon:yes gene_type:complete